MKVGDLVKDAHYGLGTIMETGRPDGVEWVRVFFPQMSHLNSGGRVRLYGTHARTLKVISKK